MARERAADDVVGRASALRRAGLPAAAVVALALAGAPGFWEFFFNTTDDEARVKAEVAYQMLKAQAEALTKQTEQQGRQIDQLRDTINQMLLQHSMGVRQIAVAREVAEPAPLPRDLDQIAAATLARE